jgi:hypothetical protein
MIKHVIVRKRFIITKHSNLTNSHHFQCAMSNGNMFKSLFYIVYVKRGEKLGLMESVDIFFKSRDWIHWPDYSLADCLCGIQTRTLAGFVAVACRSRTTISEIQGIGSFAQTS